MKNFRILILLILILTMSCTNKNNELNDKDIKKIVKNFEKNNHFSGIISLMNGNNKKYEYKFEKGYVNLKEDIFEKESKFPIGELTTQYTAVVLLKLFYQKFEAIHDSKEEIIKDIKLALDSPISIYLDDSKHWDGNKPNWLNQVTIHHLLTHTSGIADSERQLTFSNIDKNQDITSICKDLGEKNNLLFAPGDRFYFSNNNYYLLSLIIEKLAGKNFHEVIDEQLFNKYQLKSTLNPDTGTIKSLKNKSNYRGVVEQFTYNPFNYKAAYKIANNFSEFAQMQGSSSIISNIEDLHSWNISLHKSKIILNEDLYAIMTEKHVSHKGIFYGYGLSFAEKQDKKIFFNAGMLDNYTSLMVFANDKSLVMLSNLSADHNEMIVRFKDLKDKFSPFVINSSTQEVALLDELYNDYNNNGNLANLINKFSNMLLNKK